jgi:hypothetical protein
VIRVYHPFHVWEDWKAGMWRKVSGKEEKALLAKAVEFTGDAELYGQWMNLVPIRWPMACEHNLTDLSQNRRAWIGHAACQPAIGCPEHVTRSAWGFLTNDQQDLANAQADKVISAWERQGKHNELF